MSDPITFKLAQYTETDTTVRLVRGILGALPGAPEYVHYGSIDDAVRALDPNASDATIAVARANAVNDDVSDLMWMANLLDSADQGYAVFTGIKTLWNLFKKKSDAMELDEEQRNDAIAKALAVSYMAYKAVPGPVTQKVGKFAELPSGEAMLYYYGAAEVALPFADNLAAAGGNALDHVLGDRVDGQMKRLMGLAGGKDLSVAPGMLNALKDKLGSVVGVAAQNVDKIAGASSPYLPGMASAADKATGVAATAADLLPVYRLLGARLAAESAAMRALTPPEV